MRHTDACDSMDYPISINHSYSMITLVSNVDVALLINADISWVFTDLSINCRTAISLIARNPRSSNRTDYPVCIDLANIGRTFCKIYITFGIYSDSLWPLQGCICS